MTLMRFFTPEWRDGELSDDEYESTVTRYGRHLQEIRDVIPDELRRFADSSFVHDALVRNATFDADRTFRLALRSGDLQSLDTRTWISSTETSTRLKEYRPLQRF